MKKKGLLKCIGVDIGKRNCEVCIMDSNGAIIKETNYNNDTLEQAESFASRIKTRYDGGESTAVCESTGNLWLKTSQAFEKHNLYALSAMLSFRRSLSFIPAMRDIMGLQVHIISSVYFHERAAFTSNLVSEIYTHLLHRRDSKFNGGSSSKEEAHSQCLLDLV
jgi:hypothetical protein